MVDAPFWAYPIGAVFVLLIAYLLTMSGALPRDFYEALRTYSRIFS